MYGKTQIADHFPWIESAHQAVDDALMALVRAAIFLHDDPGWIPDDPDPGRLPDPPRFSVPEDQVEDRIRLAQLTPKSAQNNATRCSCSS